MIKNEVNIFFVLLFSLFLYNSCQNNTPEHIEFCIDNEFVRVDENQSDDFWIEEMYFIIEDTKCNFGLVLGCTSTKQLVQPEFEIMLGDKKIILDQIKLWSTKENLFLSSQEVAEVFTDEIGVNFSQDNIKNRINMFYKKIRIFKKDDNISEIFFSNNALLKVSFTENANKITQAYAK